MNSFIKIINKLNKRPFYLKQKEQHIHDLTTARIQELLWINFWKILNSTDRSCHITVDRSYFLDYQHLNVPMYFKKGD